LAGDFNIWIWRSDLAFPRLAEFSMTLRGDVKSDLDNVWLACSYPTMILAIFCLYDNDKKATSLPYWSHPPPCSALGRSGDRGGWGHQPLLSAGTATTENRAETGKQWQAGAVGCVFCSTPCVLIRPHPTQSFAT
jgi:hypothetical protein